MCPNYTRGILIWLIQGARSLIEIDIVFSQQLWRKIAALGGR